MLAERERRPDIAAEHYRDALKVNPGFGPSRANLARVLFAAGRFDEAREQFLRLVEVDPGQLAGRTGLAETLLQLGRPSESDAVVDKAIQDLGESPELAILLARRQLRQGELEKAEATLLPLTTSHDDNARAAWSWIAATRLTRGDLPGALASSGEDIRPRSQRSGGHLCGRDGAPRNQRPASLGLARAGAPSFAATTASCGLSSKKPARR